MSLLQRINLRRRKLRKERTPYYMVGITDELADYVRAAQASFIGAYARDYEDEDPQFWSVDRTGLSERPVPMDGLDDFLQRLGSVMLATKHPPAHVHAMLTTRHVIFGCGDGKGGGSCFDMDHCDRCNFRSVPEGWTKSWEDATRQWEKWAPNSYAPGVPDVLRVGAAMRR